MIRNHAPRHKLGWHSPSTKETASVPANLAPGSLQVRGSGTAYAVYLGHTPITGYYTSIVKAMDAATAIENRSRWIERACLTCGGTMLSTGPHHRMCDACRAEAQKIA